MNSKIIPEQNCPTCGKKFDSVTGVLENDIPKPDDISLCLYCGEILRFDNELRTKVLSAREYLILDFTTRLYITKAITTIKLNNIRQRN